MKLSILTFLFTFLACAYAAALTEREELANEFADLGVPEDAQNDLIQAVESGSVVPVELPDGRLNLTIFYEGEYQGYVLQTEDGEVEAFDENGVQISLEELEGLGDELVEKRWVPAAVLAFRVAWFIGKHISKASKIGKALLRVAKCIGWEDMWKCREDWAKCIQHGKTPDELYTCFKGIYCLGRQVVTCKKKFW
ncbi:uncharacterized protein DNG_09608 [Cephalotrichum gorgonifer]|uniref:Uncharacterized protein n=1 Tax=Cephalotrichum gorgonifer TaxID=2041049 RepID=A0AAE8SZH4_9PEZI|nr:uncharacterized protein DNG_09608 [Cephalotrichum gorgonifer]